MVKRNGLWLHFSWTTYCQITFVRSNSLKLILNWVLLNHASSSTQLISASTQLSAAPSRLFEPKYRTSLGNFPKFRPKNSKLSIWTENWYTWYIGGADSESGLRFLKIWLKNPFWGRFGPKKSKWSFLLENQHKWYLEDADSYFNIRFLNFQPKIYFWANLSQKSQSCTFCLKIGPHGILRMLILISTLFSEFPTKKPFLGNFALKKAKLCFAWKLARTHTHTHTHTQTHTHTYTQIFSKMLIPISILVF